MKAVDTNILVRFLMGDDEQQTQVVYKLFKIAKLKREALFVPLLVVLELIWVLESIYQIPRVEILNSINDLLLMPILKFENSSILHEFILSAKDNTYDLSDLLIAYSANQQGCEAVITFDKKASKFKFFELA